jgi:hypothetical protein
LKLKNFPSARYRTSDITLLPLRTQIVKIRRDRMREQDDDEKEEEEEGRIPA